MSTSHRLRLIGIATLIVSLTVRRSSADDAYSDATELYQTGQWQQAAAAFDRMSRDFQQDASMLLTAKLYSGECLVELGQYAKARQHYQFVLQHQFAQQQGSAAKFAAQAEFRLGELAWLANNAARAAPLLQTYVETYPLHSSVSYAQTYLAEMREQKSSEETFAVLDEAVGWEREGRYAASLAAYHELFAQELSGPVRAEALRRGARLHDRLAQSREALSIYGKFLAEFPNSERTAEVLFAVAWLHDRLDQPTQAADYFRLVHTKFPQSAQADAAAYWLALASADKNNTDEHQSGLSMQYVDWLLAQERLPTERPQLWEQALCLKCQLVSAAGKWQHIDTLVDAAQGRLRTGPLKTKLDFWGAEAAFRLRRYDAARTRFTALQPRTIGIDEPWTAMVPLRRAQLAARRQQWTEVLKILDQLERDFPDFELDYEVDYLRGRALAGRGNMTAARKFYRRVVANRSATDTEAATMAGWMMGETFFHQKDYPRARRAYENVMEQTALPEWQSRAALQAGKCWELEHHWEEAAGVYTAALERWPNSESDPELESRLRWVRRNSTQQR